MSDVFIAQYYDGELVLSGKREPAGSLAVRVLNLPKATVAGLEVLCRKREPSDAAKLERMICSLDIVAGTAVRIPLDDCVGLINDIICFRVYIRRYLSLSLSGKGAEDFYAFSTELDAMSAQLRRENNLRRTVLSTALSPSISFAVDGGKLCERMSFSSLRELLLFDLLRAMEHSRTPRACQCCGEYFVPTRSGEVYCTGTAPDGEGKTCREIGARRRFAEKLSGNDTLRLYRAACGRVYTRKSRGAITAADAADMIVQCTTLRDRALGGELSIEQLAEQLARATRCR